MLALPVLLVAACISSAPGVRILKKSQAAIEEESGSKRAIVTLLYGTSPPSLLNLRTMMSSARRHGSKADRLVMMPQGDPALGFRSLLESDGIGVVEVPGLDAPEGMRVPPSQRGMATGNWSGVFTKFRAFNLTGYDKVLLVDGDTYFAGKGNADEIFEECGSSEVCMVEDGQPEQFQEDCADGPELCRQLNTGVMVFTPSEQRLDSILEALSADRNQYHYTEQQFFSRYLRLRNETLSWKVISPFWNCCGNPKPPPANPGSRMWIGHLCGGWGQGYAHKFCTEKSTCPPKLRAWQVEALAMDRCLSKQTNAACDADHSCGWRGTYCMDKRMDGTGITFQYEAS